MPHALQEEVVGILNQCERETYWPPVWRTGFVHSLEKKEGAVQVNEFRPVIIYSMIYRSWGSLRAQRFLSFLSRMADEKQLGFMPGREVAEVWMLLQGLVEKSVQQGEDLMGCVSPTFARLLSPYLGIQFLRSRSIWACQSDLYCSGNTFWRIQRDGFWSEEKSVRLYSPTMVFQKDVPCPA
jgi:hypothetical protein